MRKKALEINNYGWTTIQKADAKKHIVEIACFADNGVVTQVRIRHNDGEETEAKVLHNGENILPANMYDFAELFGKGELDIR